MSDERAIITFQGVAQSLAAEEALLASGLKVGIMSRPVELGSECGFCLRVRLADLEKALGRLSTAGLPWQGAWVEVPGGRPRWRPARPGDAPAGPGAGERSRSPATAKPGREGP